MKLVLKVPVLNHRSYKHFLWNKGNVDSLLLHLYVVGSTQFYRMSSIKFSVSLELKDPVNNPPSIKTQLALTAPLG